MTHLVRLQQHARLTLRRFSVRALYVLARVLADELAARESPAALEARALELALLVEAREAYRNALGLSPAA